MKLKIVGAIALLVFIFSSTSQAQQKVVVIPLIGNGSELKPLARADVLDVRTFFTRFEDSRLIFPESDEFFYVITSILVSPEQYPSTRRPIVLRFCRQPRSSCSNSWDVPNDDVTKLDFGLGEIYDRSLYIDIPNRGGLPENVANQISIHVSGYRVRK